MNFFKKVKYFQESTFIGFFNVINFIDSKTDESNDCGCYYYQNHSCCLEICQ